MYYTSRVYPFNCFLVLAGTHSFPFLVISCWLMFLFLLLPFHTHSLLPPLNDCEGFYHYTHNYIIYLLGPRCLVLFYLLRPTMSESLMY